jgi:hypothetical protein
MIVTATADRTSHAVRVPAVAANGAPIHIIRVSCLK